jgi:transposase-like protein
MKTPQLIRDRRGCVRRSAQERHKLIEAYQQSGLSKTDFCHRHHLHLTTFSGWLKKRPAFAEVSLPADWQARAPVSTIANGTRLQIDLPQGLCVRVHDPDMLKGLAAFIREVMAC